MKANPKAIAPWDVKGYKVKDGPFTPGGAMASVGGNAMVSKQTKPQLSRAAQYFVVHL